MQFNLTEEQQKMIKNRSARFRRFFSGPDGEFVLNELDKFTNYKANTFNLNPYQCAYNTGQRSVSVFIHSVIDWNIEKAEKLLNQKELKNEKQM